MRLVATVFTGDCREEAVEQGRSRSLDSAGLFLGEIAGGDGLVRASY